MTKSKVALILIITNYAFLMSGCEYKSENSTDATEAPVYMVSSSDLRKWVGHVCGLSMERAKYCPTDFVRLGSSPRAADGKEVWILGYLAIDNRQLVLFATEEDYLDMQYGRSIRLRGTREQLARIFSEFGNKKVRLGGVFRANHYDDPGNDRLGDLMWPISGSVASPREDLGGIDDIGVDIEDIHGGISGSGHIRQHR